MDFEPLTFTRSLNPAAYRVYSFLVAEWIDWDKRIARREWCKSCWAFPSFEDAEARFLNGDPANGLSPLHKLLKGDWQAIVHEDEEAGFRVCGYYYKGTKTEPPTAP